MSSHQDFWGEAKTKVAVLASLTGISCQISNPKETEIPLYLAICATCFSFWLHCLPLLPLYEEKVFPSTADLPKKAGMMDFYQADNLPENQCSSSLVETIDVPLPLVRSLVCRFDNLQAYKHFVKSCTLTAGDGTGVGSIRNIVVISGLPANISTEQLDVLDEDLHIMGISFIGGDHCLVNYWSMTTLDEEEDKQQGRGAGNRSVVTESYVLDIPVGSNKEDTCLFADTIIRCNLKSLAKLSEKMACTVDCF